MFFRIPDWLRYEIQERWERLAVRKWINKNPRLIIGITCASMFVLLLIVIGQLAPEETVKTREYKKAWFYDLNTGELFVARSDAIPPIEAPSGPLPNGQPAGVRAYVFSFSDEPNEFNRFIGFLEIPDPQAKKNGAPPAESGAGGARRWGQDRLIRRVKDKQWVPANSEQGQAILRKISLPDRTGRHTRYCPPE
ncbi:hypothetical protein ES703_62761 [subsurface metagenome]